MPRGCRSASRSFPPPGAVILGTLAGMALARFGAFRGRTLLAGMTHRSDRHAGSHHRAVAAAAVRRHGAADRLAAGRRARSRSHSRTSPSAWPTSPWSCSRGSPASTSRSRRRPWTSARARLKVFFRITLPLILPAIASGWLLAFTLSWDDLVITQFVAGPGSSTLPMVIFSKVRFGVTPDINALATIMVLIVATGIAISTYGCASASGAACGTCSWPPRRTCKLHQHGGATPRDRCRRLGDQGRPRGYRGRAAAGGTHLRAHAAPGHARGCDSGAAGAGGADFGPRRPRRASRFRA